MSWLWSSYAGGCERCFAFKHPTLHRLGGWNVRSPAEDPQLPEFLFALHQLYTGLLDGLLGRVGASMATWYRFKKASGGGTNTLK